MSTTPPPPPPPPPPSGPSGPWPPPPSERQPTPPRPPADAPAPIVPAGDQRLAPQVVTLWRAGGAIPFGLLLLPAVAVGAGLGGVAWLLPLLVGTVGVLVVALVPPLRHRHWRWRMTQRALELEYGVVIRQVRALPYFRIQHIDVEHGPLDRWLGLARLEVHTASVTATLPGLPADQAPGVRAALLQFAAAAVTGEQGDDAV